MEARPLEGRTALVTGASRGIGRAVAERLCRDGARILGVARSLEGLEKTLGACREIEAGRGGGGAKGYAADLSEPGAVEDLKEALRKDGQEVDILVNNAGLTRDGLFVRLSEEDWDEVLQVDLKAPFLLARAFARSMMRRKWGRILQIGSVVGLMGNAGQVNYAAAKAGLLGLTRSLARELGGRGITVNLVAPGFIETDMTASLDAKVREAMLGGIPLGRLGSPEDVAASVAFLAGPGGDWITGQVLVVDGGMHMG